MRPSFVLALLVAFVVACVSVTARANAAVQPKLTIEIASSMSTRRYLKGRQGGTVNDDEERLFTGAIQKMPGFNKIKAAFQNNPSFAKNLEKFRMKRQRLDEFFKENPVIKKEIIVASVLLTLIFSVPIVVNAFYPA
ncbi:secreted RxLR effector peptide protein, putative [Phytophthora infestans T30-4]|uniref:Secreted RxLR effector peptide protein n=2 Tax=Phytophthora infestans TaxID=4787 RepID=A0A8S9V7D4_PHYIN